MARRKGTRMRTFTVTIPGLPEECPYCGHEPKGRAWAAGYHAIELTVACPACYSQLGRVAAVPDAAESSSKEEES